MEPSGRPDLNRGPHRPERCALPGCATPRGRPSVSRPTAAVAADRPRSGRALLAVEQAGGRRRRRSARRRSRADGAAGRAGRACRRRPGPCRRPSSRSRRRCPTRRSSRRWWPCRSRPSRRRSSSGRRWSRSSVGVVDGAGDRCGRCFATVLVDRAVGRSRPTVAPWSWSPGRPCSVAPPTALAPRLDGVAGRAGSDGRATRRRRRLEADPALGPREPEPPRSDAPVRRGAPPREPRRMPGGRRPRSPACRAPASSSRRASRSIDLRVVVAVEVAWPPGVTAARAVARAGSARGGLGIALRRRHARTGAGERDRRHRGGRLHPSRHRRLPVLRGRHRHLRQRGRGRMRRGDIAATTSPPNHRLPGPRAAAGTRRAWPAPNAGRGRRRRSPPSPRACGTAGSA